MIYTLTFNPALDYVMDVDHVSFGGVNRSRGEKIFFGGKGVNVSLVLGELGVMSTALGFIGGFTGDALEMELRNRGVKTDFCRLRYGMTRINVKLRGGEVTEINGAGPLIGEDDMSGLYGKLDSLKVGDTLVIAGSIPSSLPRDTYERIMERLSGRGIRFAVDAEGELLTNSLKYRPFLIKPNVHELSAIEGRELNDKEEILASASRLKADGAENVLVSLGGDGALLLDRDGVSHFRPAFKGIVRNTVGAGDSMLAGFLSAADEGFERALFVGTAAGGATAFSDGLADREGIEKLLLEVK